MHIIEPWMHSIKPYCTTTWMPDAQHWAIYTIDVWCTALGCKIIAILMHDAQHWGIIIDDATILSYDGHHWAILSHIEPILMPYAQHRCGLADIAHTQDVQNGVAVDGVRGDLYHSSRTEAFSSKFQRTFCLTSNKKRCGGLGMDIGRSEVP